jgi:hypothetical protein
LRQARHEAAVCSQCADLVLHGLNTVAARH